MKKRFSNNILAQNVWELQGLRGKYEFSFFDRFRNFLNILKHKQFQYYGVDFNAASDASTDKTWKAAL